MASVSVVPTRLDFCGGTLDIYPLYLLYGGAKVINLSIDITVTATLDYVPERENPLLQSRDLNTRVDLANQHNDEDLPYHRAILEYFELEHEPIILKTESHAPIGSGLGGSSSLLIAMVKAAADYCELRLSDPEIQTIAQDIETSYLKVPTGTQDYLAAMNTGMRTIHYDIGGVDLEPIPEPFARAIEERIYLIYTGQSHLSAKENWEMFKAEIDKAKSNSSGIFGKLRNIAEEMYQEAIQMNTEAFLTLINKEWQLRKRLLPNMETSRMHEIARILDNEKLATGIKGCGAGGGGSIMVVGEPNAEEDIRSLVEPLGGRLLPFHGYYDNS